MKIKSLILTAAIVLAPAAIAQQEQIARPGIKKVQVAATSLRRAATISLGGAPDWLAISEEAVWVANSKFKSVQRIDPKTNSIIAKIEFFDEPCSGLTFAFGTLWVPLCGKPASLARVEPRTNKIVATLPFGPADSEGGISASDDSIWLIADENGTLLRIDPQTNTVRQKISVPPGSFNPLYSRPFLWVTGNKTSVLTPVDSRTGEALASIPVGPQPRFLASGAGYIWTLNQGDGSVTRVSEKTRHVVGTTQVGIPGPGGDICYAQGAVWATVFDVPLTMIFAESDEVLHQWVGPGGDAIRFGHRALWLTDLRNGLLWRIDPPKP